MTAQPERKARPSAREARRLLEQGAVSIDGQKPESGTAMAPGMVVQVGKRRWHRLV